MLMEFGDTRVVIECAEDKGWVFIKSPGLNVSAGYGKVVVKRDKIDIKTEDGKRYTCRIMGSKIRVRKNPELKDPDYGKRK
jgi:hypothetical protein